jgi:hypothetical protein
MKLTCIALAMAAVAVPALAGELHRTPAERDRLIGRCIAEYGAQWADRCVQIIDPSAAGLRARRDFLSRSEQLRELARKRECWEDKTIINPRSCAEGLPPVRSRATPR